MKRVPSGMARMLSMMESTVCCLISLPQTGQCGTPQRAYKRRR